MEVEEDGNGGAGRYKPLLKSRTIRARGDSIAVFKEFDNLINKENY